MPFEIVRNDITNMQVDAIVNTANPRPVIGSGTDAAIHAKAGPMLLLTRKCIGTIDTGEAVITPGFRLPAKYVIHTVGPVWEKGSRRELRLLRQCYENSLALAKKKRLKSIAFPLISSGNYGFPKELALKIATEAIREFLMHHDMDVFLVVFTRDAVRLAGSLQEEIRSFIYERHVQKQTAKEYSFSVRSEYEPVQKLFEPLPDDEEEEDDDFWLEFEPALYPEEWEEEEVEDGAPAPPKCGNRERRRPAPLPRRDTAPAPRAAFRPAEPAAPAPESLKQILRKLDAGFSETLLQLIDRTGKKDSEIYRKANVSRQHFSKIRNNPHYQPTKSTALAFAIALELDLEQTKDLIGRAGFALTNSSTSDLIIMYFIEKQHYNIIDINTALFEFDQSLLGA